MNSFYTREELEQIGFKSIGENVLISRKASIYGCKEIKIGNHVRIDDFCLLSGKIEIGNYVHISAYTSLYGGEEGIYVGDFVAISSRCAVYAVSDDYSGEYMTNPMVPEECTNITQRRVAIEKHVIIGTGSTILPGVCVKEGVAVGAMSLILHDLDAWTIYAGIPCKRMKERSKNALSIEQNYFKA